MGCSPPASWYEAQNAFYYAKEKREHEVAVAKLLNTIQGMTDEEKSVLRSALGPQEEEI